MSYVGSRLRASLVRLCTIASLARLCTVATPFAAIGAGLVSGTAQGAEGCPNEALRQELDSGALPDCRAYEMVSPAFVDGAEVNFKLASRDGSRVIVQALGSFAGTGSEPYLNTEYELSRGEDGWLIAPLDPPAAQSPESTFFGASPELSQTLWGLHAASQSIYEEDLYLRESDGRFTLVGPLAPPSGGEGPPSGTTTTFGRTLLVRGSYVAADSDLSHVMVRVEGLNGVTNDVWPGDTTLGANSIDSLYEYVGVGNTRPQLVGVGPTGANISSCGTELGSAEEVGDKYNTISANGESVFFTGLAGGCVGRNAQGESVTGTGPPVNELYARLAQIETVDLSEPTFSQCAVCRTGIATPREPAIVERSAEFQGASEDGTKAFFTTTQELLEGQTTENLYEYDFDNQSGEKVVLVSRGATTPEVEGVARVSEDGSHVYFVAKGALTGENVERRAPVPGDNNLYVFTRNAADPEGRLTYIAALSNADARDWSPQDFRPVQATANGRFLVFESAADLTADDTSTVPQIFEYDAEQEKLVRVSVGHKTPAGYMCATTGEVEEGYNCNGNTSEHAAAIGSPEDANFVPPVGDQSNLALSADGAYIFFQSDDALSPLAVEAAAADASSVYEYHSDVDAAGGSIANGNVFLLSDGKDVSRGGSELAETDTSGDDVFFLSSDQLVDAGRNSGRNLYDARVDGGLAEVASLDPCEGSEACQGAPIAPPSFGVPASELVAPGATAPPTATRTTRAPARAHTLAEQLSAALKACRREFGTKRHGCEARARKKYGSPTRKRAGRHGR